MLTVFMIPYLLVCAQPLHYVQCVYGGQGPPTSCLTLFCAILETQKFLDYLLQNSQSEASKKCMLSVMQINTFFYNEWERLTNDYIKIRYCKKGASVRKINDGAWQGDQVTHKTMSTVHKGRYFYTGSRKTVDPSNFQTDGRTIWITTCSVSSKG